MATPIALAASPPPASDRPGDAPRPANRLAPALAVSIVAHAGLLGALVWTWPPAPPAVVAIEVRLVETPRGAAAGGGRPASGVQASPGAREPPGTARPGARPSRPAVARPDTRVSTAGHAPARPASLSPAGRSEPVAHQAQTQPGELAVSPEARRLEVGGGVSARAPAGSRSATVPGEHMRSAATGPVADGAAAPGGVRADGGSGASSRPDRTDAGAGADVTGVELDLIRERIARAVLYPPAARRSRLQGRVVVRFTVRRDGGVQDVQVTASSGYDALDRSAVSAVLSAAPFRIGKGTGSVTTPIVFRLE